MKESDICSGHPQGVGDVTKQRAAYSDQKAKHSALVQEEDQR
jgi:hypothetical protein